MMKTVVKMLLWTFLLLPSLSGSLYANKQDIKFEFPLPGCLPWATISSPFRAETVSTPKEFYIVAQWSAKRHPGARSRHRPIKFTLKGLHNICFIHLPPN